jgi:peptide/nickel transport system ATP-binding protein
MIALLEVRNLSVVFTMKHGWLSRAGTFTAVNDVSFRLLKGDAVGIVGESGSGKSTVAAALLNLRRPTAGSILLDGAPVETIGRLALARRVQPVFQDPYSSLNPYRRIARIIAEPLDIHAIGVPRERQRAVAAMMERVGLPQRLATRYPAELSGGQRQRVAIARALMLQPEILVCDEPTSALDVSVQAQIMHLLQELKSNLHISFVFISHNLAVVEQIADEVIVMQHGRIVESGRGNVLFNAPRHPYTRLLVDSVLSPDPDHASFRRLRPQAAQPSRH